MTMTEALPTITDGYLIAATIAGPILAVQAQKWIERARERRQAQKQIFYTLMATRATRLSPQHIQALNMIDLEFSGQGWRGQSANEKAVVAKWRIYVDHLGALAESPTQSQLDLWVQQGDDLFTDLLEALGKALRYKFDRVQLKRGIYHPKGHTDQEIRQEVAQRALVDLLTGRTALPMKVVEFPYSEEAAALQTKVHEAFLSSVSDGAIQVKRPT